MSVVVAAVEVGLIGYMGRIVDLMSGDPSQVWADHKTEFILVTVFVLLFRPLLQGLDVLLLNQAMLPNFGTLIRWRAHKHVLRQSVGWFENDFAGRIASSPFRNASSRSRPAVPTNRSVPGPPSRTPIQSCTSALPFRWSSRVMSSASAPPLNAPRMPDQK